MFLAMRAPVEAMRDFLIKFRLFKFFDMIYLSSISVVLLPMNVISPFTPSAVWQPINMKTTKIKIIDRNILLIIFKLLSANYLFTKSVESADFRNR
jgi:hypothetical protein